MIIAPSERARDIYCRKGRVQVDSDPLHIHAGLKSVASPTGTGRETGRKKKRAEGTMERIPIIHDAGWRAQSGNPGLFEQPRETYAARSLISLFVLAAREREFVGKIHFRHGRRTDAAGKIVDCDAIVRLTVSFSFPGL